MSINLKCCNLIGAATIVAALMSEVCVSYQTHRLRNGSGSTRLVSYSNGDCSIRVSLENPAIGVIYSSKEMIRQSHIITSFARTLYTFDYRE